MCDSQQKKEPELTLSRRRFIRAAGLLTCAATLPLGLSGCERHRYDRPAGELDLGAVKDLLYDVSHVREASVLVFRDIDGWSVLSTRCTYIGCDLTYQEPEMAQGTALLLCPCCRTRFRLTGDPYEGWPATVPLPWLDVYYRDGHLYAEPGRPKPRSFRFTTPQIEEAILELRKRIKDRDIISEVKIPEVLLGKGDGEVGGMFLEDDPNLIYELDMIK
jgi:nitrite reductase/ring-hydroxylating ferredoxin subunit